MIIQPSPDGSLSTNPGPRRDSYRRSSVAQSGPRSQHFARNQYVLASEIASGGMASVHIALQRGEEGFHRLVAIKRIHPHLAHHREFCEMFVDEARIAARINHPNVCRIFDFGRGDDGYFLAMEYLSGEPLSRVMRALTQREDLRSSARYPLLIARVFADLAEGLHAAHMLTTERGERLDVVHRDVTPQNLFVLHDGTVRVTDFGIAQARQRVHQTQGELLKGKLAYMAPEQLQRKPLDRRVDIWALGVALWECLTLKRLFRGRSEGELLMQVMSREIPPASLDNPNVTPALDAVLERALARDPEARYQSAREFARDLERCLGWSSDTVPTMDVAEWMRDLFPGGMEKSSELIRAALGQSSLPPQASEVALDRVPPAPRLPSIELDASAAAMGSLDTKLLVPAVEPDETLVTTRVRFAPAPPTQRSLAFARSRLRLFGATAAVGVGLLLGAGLAVVTGDRPGHSAVAIPASPPPRVGLDAADARTLELAATPPPYLEAAELPAPAPSPAPLPLVEAGPAAKRTPTNTRRAPSPVAQKGALLVTAAQGSGTIYAEGTLLGRTPARLTLAPGKHVLEIRPDAGGPIRRVPVEVTSGGLALVTVVLPAPSLATPR